MGSPRDSMGVAKGFYMGFDASWTKVPLVLLRKVLKHMRTHNFLVGRAEIFDWCSNHRQYYIFFLSAFLNLKLWIAQEMMIVKSTRMA